ncbi:hypothetical protein GCM10011368_21680 [Hyunsoonleella pacifica]|nr:hypothetical protein GCM10011368_21680 [Hyunsoonleella pacifica]
MNCDFSWESKILNIKTIIAIVKNNETYSTIKLNNLITDIESLKLFLINTYVNDKINGKNRNITSSFLILLFI